MSIASFVLWVGGCGPAEPAQAPPSATSANHANDATMREQEALERRRLQLEQQLVTELRRLRERRQASAGASASDESEASDCELLIFGGPIREVFLGCLSDHSRPDSVFNLRGEHGSHLSSLSLRNKFGPYGSNHDDTSACNAKATHPPIVVAADGKSLGLLTVNPQLKRRIDAPAVTSWLARMCGI